MKTTVTAFAIRTLAIAREFATAHPVDEAKLGEATEKKPDDKKPAEVAK